MTATACPTLSIFVRYPGRTLIFAGSSDLQRMRDLHPNAQVSLLEVPIVLSYDLGVDPLILEIADAFLRRPLHPGAGDPLASRSPGPPADKGRLRELVRERNDWRRSRRGRR